MCARSVDACLGRAGAAKEKDESLPPPLGASKNVVQTDHLPEAANATAINFLEVHVAPLRVRHGLPAAVDVMLVTGRFGLKTYSLKDPAHPAPLGEVTMEQLRLPGDPPASVSSPQSTFWQNEDMDVDPDRNLALLSRDPRAYRGSTRRDPYSPTRTARSTSPASTSSTSTIRATRRSARSSSSRPATRPPASTTAGPLDRGSRRDDDPGRRGWTFGRPIIVTDLTDPDNPIGHTLDPVDLFRRDGVTAYSHDVDVDAMGIAWVSGDGGTRGYWT